MQEKYPESSDLFRSETTSENARKPIVTGRLMQGRKWVGRFWKLGVWEVNLFSKGVNDSSKVSARLCRFVCKELIRENACQPHQEKYQKLSARLCRFACKEPKSGKDRQKSHQFINSSIHQMPFSELAIFRCLILYIIYIL